MAKITSPLTPTFLSVRKQFIAKEKIIKSSLLLQKKESENKRKNLEKERFINYEKILERKIGFLGKPIKSIDKRLGFFDALKQFINNVLLGFITIRLIKYLPQLIRVLSLALKVSDFILDVSGKLLNGLVTFVHEGYKAADHAKKLVRNIGGQKAIDSLEAMNNQSNSLLNSIIIAGMLFSDFGGIGTRSTVANQAIETSKEIIQNTIKEEGLKKVAQETAKQGIRTAIGPLGAAGIVLGVGLLSSALGEGAFQIKKFGKQLQTWTSGKFSESSQDKNPITRFLKKGFFGWLSATLGPAIWLLNGTGVMFDIVGAPFRYGVELIRAAIMKLNDDRKGLEQQNKNLGKFDARVRDGIREHFSILSPLFNLIGMKGVSQKLQTPGSFGSLYGEKAARDMGYQKGGLVVKKFAGGGYTRSIGDEDKRVEIPRTFNEQLPKINPGSVVGGPNMITKIFPYSEDSETMNQYEYVESSYTRLSNSGYLGPLSGLIVKSMLGDRIVDQDYKVASQSLSSFIMEAALAENSQSYNQAFSTLGTDKFQSIVKGELIKNLSSTFGNIETQLKIQLGLLPPPQPPSESEADPCAAACDTGGSGFAVAGDDTDKAILNLISSVEAKDYDTMNVSRGATAGKPTQMTVDWLVANARGAIGRYQHMPAYVRDRVIAAGFKGSDRFTPEIQDKTTLHFLYSSHGYQRWRNGQMSDEEFGNRLSATWRGLPHSSGGTYPDQYAGRNKAHMSRPAFMARLAQIKSSGGATMAKVAPGSPAANVDPCICDPETPTGDPGNVQAAGATTGGTISGYPITSGYGMRKHPKYGGIKKHGGIDIGGMRSGAPYALNVPGVAGPPMPDGSQYESGYGNFIDIQIPSLGNLYFRFAHMSKPPNYKPGQQIPAGKIFGYAGTTGASTGVHLHFEVNKRLSGYGGDRDPTPYGKYISIGREYGGPTLSGGIRLLHKGEYVIDKDSVDLYGGPNFFSMINRVENETQRKERSSMLIQHLSKYTGRKIDQRPEIIFEDGEDYIETFSSVGTPISSINTSTNQSSEDWQYDSLFVRG